MKSRLLAAFINNSQTEHGGWEADITKAYRSGKISLCWISGGVVVRVIALCLGLMAGCSVPQPVDPCVDEYPKIAPHVVGGPAGRIANIEPVDWLKDGVYRIIVESGGDIMVKPGDLPLPPIGAVLEVRIYSQTPNSEPLAGCYCQVGTNICVAEYSYP